LKPALFYFLSRARLLAGLALASLPAYADDDLTSQLLPGPNWIWGGALGALLVVLCVLLAPRFLRTLESDKERIRRGIALKCAALGWFEYQPAKHRVRTDVDTLSELFGLDASWQDAPLERWLERIHPDDLERAHELKTKRTLAPGDEHQIKLRIRHTKGQWEWVVLRFHVHGRSARHSNVFGVCQQVSKHHQQEAELKRNEQAFHTLVDNTQDIVSRYDLELTCRFINRAINRYTSLPREEIIGQKIEARGWPEELSVRFATECRALIASHDSRRFEIEFASGARQHVFEVLLYPEMDAEEQLCSILCLEREITETRQIQLLLEEENLVLEMVAANRPLPEVLSQLCRMIESQIVQGFCSVMLLDKSGERLNMAAGPSLPMGVMKAIDGMAIGPNQGTAGSSAYWRRTIMVNDVEESPLWTEYRELAFAFGIHASWAVPIMTNDQHLLGTLAIYYSEKRSPSPDEMQLSYRSSHIAAISIERDQHEKRMYHEATRDVLTNGFNRRHFLELGTRELKRARRYAMPLALLMLDLDNFKTIHGAYGHQASDEVLRQFSRLAHNSLRGSDILGRLGGEEFAALLPATGLPEALHVAERIRRTVEQNPLEWMGKPLPCSVSVGVAVLQAEDHSIDEILTRSDQALNTAKERGPNRVASLPEQASHNQIAST
jgi:diguanylate cyclase (GGDEF)-like protein